MPFFDEVVVLANFGGGSENCLIVAEKKAGVKELAIHDEQLLHSALAAPTVA